MSVARCAVLVAAALGCTAARAAPPDIAPYRPLYPALYVDASLEYDPRDESFDAQGRRESSALPSRSGATSFGQAVLETRLAWYFPMFEQEGLPFFSGRLHTLRASLRYHRLESSGGIEDFIDANPGLERAGDGVGDTTFEFGSFLSGSAGWRDGRVGPLSTLLLVGLTLPTGIYDHDAPVNAGSNHFAAHAKLGAHGSTWRGGFLDGAVGYRVHARDEDPQFGALAPAESGDEVLWEVQFAQGLRPGLYLGIAASGSEGQANRYRDPRFSTQAQNASALSDIVPVAGTYRDQGVDSRIAVLSLRWFCTPRLAAGVHYTHPLSGRGGEFDLDLVQRTPAGCAPGTVGCLTSPAGSAHEDGLGSARSYASDRVALSITYQFGQGDTWACPGCAD